MPATFREKALARGGFDGPNQNRLFHKMSGKRMGGGSPKKTTGGRDTSKNAKNTLTTGVPHEPLGPNSNRQSRNGA